jgi:hypothetical protein
MRPLYPHSRATASVMPQLVSPPGSLGWLTYPPSTATTAARIAITEAASVFLPPLTEDAAAPGRPKGGLAFGLFIFGFLLVPEPESDHCDDPGDGEQPRHGVRDHKGQEGDEKVRVGRDQRTKHGDDLNARELPRITPLRDQLRIEPVEQSSHRLIPILFFAQRRDDVVEFPANLQHRLVEIVAGHVFPGDQHLESVRPFVRLPHLGLDIAKGLP